MNNFRKFEKIAIRRIVLFSIHPSYKTAPGQNEDESSWELASESLCVCFINSHIFQSDENKSCMRNERLSRILRRYKSRKLSSTPIQTWTQAQRWWVGKTQATVPVGKPEATLIIVHPRLDSTKILITSSWKDLRWLVQELLQMLFD
jgi:hypothetical protein